MDNQRAFQDIHEMFGGGSLNTEQEGAPADTGVPAPGGKEKPDPVKKVAELENTMSEMTKKLESATAGAKEALDFKTGLRDLFDPEGKVRAKAESETAEQIAHASDPVKFVKEIEARLETKFKSELETAIRAATAPIHAERITRTAKEWVNKRYLVGWDEPGVQEKIVEKLDQMKDEFKTKNPEKALLQAAHLAGVLQDREGTMPFVEGADGSGNGFIKQKLSEGADIKKRILERAKERNQGAFVGTL